MQEAMSFGAVLEVVETLSQEEKETLIDILNHRIAENNRRLIVEDSRQAREEFLSGNCQEATADGLMQKILS
ncbi:MAG: hypothetical protein ABI977_31410 [Acidobacteriota bacterium]